MAYVRSYETWHQRKATTRFAILNAYKLHNPQAGENVEKSNPIDGSDTNVANTSSSKLKQKQSPIDTKPPIDTGGSAQRPNKRSK